MGARSAASRGSTPNSPPTASADPTPSATARGVITLPPRSAGVRPRKIGTTRSLRGAASSRLRPQPISAAAVTVISARAQNSRVTAPRDAPRARATAISRVRPSTSTSMMPRIPTQAVASSTKRPA